MATNGNSADALMSVSPTAEALEQIALYGLPPGAGETDHRPMPDDEATSHGLAEIFDVVEGMFRDTRLEQDLEPTLWGLANLFHYRINRLQRMLDDNEDAQKQSQREQDGSEVKSYELETLIDAGLSLIERRNAFETLRDEAAALYEQRTGSTWRPSTGSMVSRRNVTAAVIDSREFHQCPAARRDRATLSARTPDCRRGRPEVPEHRIGLVHPRQGACEAPRHGLAPWR